MEKKLPAGISAVSAIIVLSNVITFLPLLPLGFGYLTQFEFFDIIQLFSMDISGMVFFVPSLLLYRVVNFILLALTILVGVGLLKLKNLARIAIVILSTINVIQNIFYLYASSRMPKVEIEATKYVDLFSVVAILINIFYIVFFTYPKVKAQFK